MQKSNQGKFYWRTCQQKQQGQPSDPNLPSNEASSGQCLQGCSEPASITATSGHFSLVPSDQNHLGSHRATRKERATAAQDGSHPHHGMTFTRIFCKAAALQPEPLTLMPSPARFSSCPPPRDARTGHESIRKEIQRPGRFCITSTLSLSLAGLQEVRAKNGKGLPASQIRSSSSEGPSFLA